MDERRPAGHAALRRGRHSIAGQIYLVTFTTWRRQPHFADAATAMGAARAIADPRLWGGSALLAWVLMPDHWHGLVALGGNIGLAATIRALKTNTARQVRLDDPGLPQVWARGYHDHALRAEEDMVETARYVVLNPVRAGLVRRVGDYPFWDAAWV
jgi:REP element-mobilizing transposase RayT